MIVNVREFDSDEAHSYEQKAFKQGFYGRDRFSTLSEAIAERINLMKEEDAKIEVFAEKGLNPYKVFTIWKHQSDLTPEPWKSITCQKPTNEEMEAVTTEKSLRTVAKTKIRKAKNDAFDARNKLMMDR